jgi:hypothetical protein
MGGRYPFPRWSSGRRGRSAMPLDLKVLIASLHPGSVPDRLADMQDL